ncbi:MAG TPA: hypothetical protein VFM69_14995 [Pricia sp.]|nr:hypothetical protein [Pricia sp.]
MKKMVCIGFLVLFLGCSGGVSEEKLPRLNGYWEIEQVVFPDGGTKEYTVNATIDYIHLEGLKGWRKKVRPKFDGTYETSDDIEEFVISERDGNFFMQYTTELSEWTEILIALNADTFSVINEDGKRYDYRRFEPFTLKPSD